MTRVDLLLEIERLLLTEGVSPSDKHNLLKLREDLLSCSITTDLAYQKLCEIPFLKVSSDWWEILKTKPIYRNLIAIADGKITDNDTVAKIVASMLTQLIIRKIADPSTDFHLLQANTYLELLKNYFSTGEIDIWKFKDIIKAYKNLGILKEER